MITDVLQFQKESTDAQLRLVPEREDLPLPSVIEQQFVSFSFLQVSPEWRKLNAEAKRLYKSEFAGVFESFRGPLLVYTYSLVGFDSKADLMFWRVGTSLDLIQEMTAKLFQTQLGSYIESTENYLSVTKRRMFVDFAGEDRQRVQAGAGKYHFFYPLPRDKNSSKITIDERDALVEENFMVGKKFPNIRIHLTHAFGLTDSEYLISFETDEPKDFIALADELHRTPASELTLHGMPVYTCRQRSLMECLDALG